MKSLSKQQQVHQPAQQLSEPVLQALLEAKQTEIVSLKHEITKLKTDLKASEDSTSELESKVNKAAVEVDNHHKKVKEILDKKMMK